MARIAVIGAGIGGLGVALAAGRDGHEVILVERDDTPMPADPHGAFDWARGGAPQVRHSHALLARLRNLLRDRHPDVLDAVLDAGASPLDFIAMLPEGMDRTPVPGDDDLVALACRRTTFEWVLRRIVVGEAHTTLRHGVAVRSLVAEPAGSVPVIRGLELSDGTRLRSDLVVDASGRRSPLPLRVSELGGHLPEDVDDTGIIYFSRFFRLNDGADHPPQVGPIGGDLGHLKYGVFQGDNRTFSITLACNTDDDELRRHLLDPDSFLRVAASLPATAAHVTADRSTPTTEVHVMAKLLNRRRWFLDREGTPRVLGLHAVGDAHTCTNPLYGRGCSLAMVQAHLLVDALDDAGSDDDARARHYEAACVEEITPWYRAAVSQDRMSRAAAVDPEPDNHAQDLLREGLFPALRSDPVVLRAFLRMLNLLAPPQSLMSDPDVVGRIMASYAERDQRPPAEPLGPDRDELLDALSAA